MNKLTILLMLLISAQMVYSYSDDILLQGNWKSGRVGIIRYETDKSIDDIFLNISKGNESIYQGVFPNKFKGVYEYEMQIPSNEIKGSVYHIEVYIYQGEMEYVKLHNAVIKGLTVWERIYLFLKTHIRI